MGYGNNTTTGAPLLPDPINSLRSYAIVGFRTTQEVAPRVQFRLTSFFNGGSLPSCFVIWCLFLDKEQTGPF